MQPTLVTGDITEQRVDAIVNAANCALSGGGGVDGAIHSAAGPELLASCRKLGRCPTGEARITPAFNLPSKYVIHAVGPVWQGGGKGEPELLRSAYQNALSLAKENVCRTVAFPAISCGIYGYPLNLASEIAVQAINAYASAEYFDSVAIVCFNSSTRSAFEQALRAH